MKTSWRSLTFAGVLAIGGLLGANPGEALAQYPAYPAGTIVVPAAPRVTTGRTTYVLPKQRRTLRAERRYVTRRPTYAGRSALTFAPYSDHYNTTLFAPPAGYLPAPPR